jgi:hypothetical protein
MFPLSVVSSMGLENTTWMSDVIATPVAPFAGSTLSTEGGTASTTQKFQVLS